MTKWFLISTPVLGALVMILGPLIGWGYAIPIVLVLALAIDIPLVVSNKRRNAPDRGQPMTEVHALPATPSAGANINGTRSGAPEKRLSEPLFEMCETWQSSMDVAHVMAAISEAFKSSGKVQAGGDWVEVHQGSAFHYRIWGELLAGKSVPVMLRLEVMRSGEGSTIHAHANDTFGTRITNRVFFGAQATFVDAISALMATAERLANVTSKRPGPHS